METANYCFVTQRKTLRIFLRELESLLQKGGLFFQVFEKVPISGKDFEVEEKDI